MKIITGRRREPSLIIRNGLKTTFNNEDAPFFKGGQLTKGITHNNKIRKPRAFGNSLDEHNQLRRSNRKKRSTNNQNNLEVRVQAFEPEQEFDISTFTTEPI